MRRAGIVRDQRANFESIVYNLDLSKRPDPGYIDEVARRETFVEAAGRSVPPARTAGARASAIAATASAIVRARTKPNRDTVRKDVGIYPAAATSFTLDRPFKYELRVQ